MSRVSVPGRSTPIRTVDLRPTPRRRRVNVNPLPGLIELNRQMRVDRPCKCTPNDCDRTIGRANIGETGIINSRDILYKQSRAKFGSTTLNGAQYCVLGRKTESGKTRERQARRSRQERHAHTGHVQTEVFPDHETRHLFTAATRTGTSVRARSGPDNCACRRRPTLFLSWMTANSCTPRSSTWPREYAP